MDKRQRVIEKAKTKPAYLKLLNFTIANTIPFNKPHGFRIANLGDYHIQTTLPYKRKNMNHLRGIHACALATLCEFTTGALLIFNLDAKKYRIILESLEVKYHYQCKTAATARYEINDDWLQNTVIQPLENKPAVFVPCPIELYDTQNNLVCSATVNWQIKDWQKVRTKV